MWGWGKSLQSPGPGEPAEPAGRAVWVLRQAACFSGLRGLGGLRVAPSPTLGAAAFSCPPAAGAPALSLQPRSVPRSQCGTRMATWPLVKQEGAGVGPGPQGCKSAALPDLSSAASELCGLRASHLPLVCLSVKCPSNTCLPARFPSVESPCAWLGRSPQGPTARRFSWLMGTSSELLQPWELTKMSSLLREQLPLQKTLLPTRSIPVRG